MKKVSKDISNLTAETASSQIFFSELLRMRYRGKREIQNSAMKCGRISRECFWSQLSVATSHRRDWPVAEAQESLRALLPSSLLALPPLSPSTLSHLLSPSLRQSFSLPHPTILLCFLPIFPGSFPPILPLGSQTTQKMTSSRRVNRLDQPDSQQVEWWGLDPKPSLKIPRDTPQP